jgi:uncharacterized protein involved in outer membrane biogenesis
MSKSTKIILIAGGGSAGLLLVAVLAVALSFDINAYKPRVEALASQALGMDVKVDGPMGFSLLPGLTVTLRDVHLRKHGAEVASADEIRLKLGLWPLMRRQVQVETLTLNHPALLVEQETDGSFNLSQTGASGNGLPAVRLAEVTVADGDFRYVDERYGNEVAAQGCNLEVHGLRLAAGKVSDLMQDLEFTGELACRNLRHKGYAVTDLRAGVAAKQGILTLDPVTLQVFGVQGSGSLRADYSAAITAYAVQYSLPQFQVAEFFKTLLSAQPPPASGRMDFSATLTFQGPGTAAMTRSLAGQFSLRGKDLVLEGHDLDTEFSHFESSQHFNLVDLGALFFAGPVGLVVTKSYNFANLLRASGGSSKIHVLVSDWKFQRGIAQAEDVAMTTDRHRLALDGRLDFNDGKFDAVTVALIDAQGCAIVKQRITGNFQSPVVEKPSIIRTLSGPVLKMIKRGRDLFPGGKCEVFYSGSVGTPSGTP